MTEQAALTYLRQNWNSLKEEIQEEYQITTTSYNTWIQPLEFSSLEGNNVIIFIPADLSYMKKYISDRYKKFFEVMISEKFGEEYTVTFEMAPKEEEVFAEREELLSGIRTRVENSNLNSRYHFDTFIVGANNKLAHSASLAVAEAPGNAFNPLFIYGGAGLGKTHLMHSIGHYVLENNPYMRVLYVTSEQFTNEVIDSIRSRTSDSMAKFRDKYRTVDVLLIDDIQFIIGKDATQEEFFHTFNELHSAGKQIVLSSDRPPKEMETLDERFRSRFGWGLIVDIQAPDFETRMAILKKNAELAGVFVDNLILEYIATNIKSNIRELEGAFNKIIAYARLNNVEITLSSAKEALKDVIYVERDSVVSPENIIETVCDHYNVRKEDIISRKRSTEFVIPRQVIMFILREYTSLTLDGIGKQLGGKDHTTVMHGADKIKVEIIHRPELKSNVESILKKLNIPF